MAKKVDRAARRGEILDAAVRVFARKGFPASRVEDVAAEAGVAKGSVYLYFDSREALLAAVFEDYAARSAATLAEARRPGPPLERLAALVRSTLAELAAHTGHARVLLDLWSAGPPLDMAAVYRAHRDAVAELLAEAAEAGELRAGVGERHAAVIVGALEGCLVQWLADPAVPLAELAEPVVDLCLHGVRR